MSTGSAEIAPAPPLWVRLRPWLRHPGFVVPLLLLAAVPNLELPTWSEPLTENRDLDGIMKLRGIQRASTVWDAFGYFMGDDPQGVHTFRPLPAFCLWVDYHLFGFRNWPYVLISWLWFVATGIALWRLYLAIAVPDWGALAAAALTMQRVTRGTEGTIRYVAARHDVRCVCFAVLALLWLVHFLHTGRRRHLVGFLLASLLAYLCKEMAVALVPISLGVVVWYWRHAARAMLAGPVPASRRLWWAAGGTVLVGAVWFGWYKLAEQFMGPVAPAHSIGDWKLLLTARWRVSAQVAALHLSEPLGMLVYQYRAGVNWTALIYPPFWKALFGLAVQVGAIVLLARRHSLWVLLIYLWKIATWIPVLPFNNTWPWYEYMPHMLDTLLLIGAACELWAERASVDWPRLRARLLPRFTLSRQERSP